jgi:FtsP/CotA-like multicopper oxidase with cupredoxin domain
MFGGYRDNSLPLASTSVLDRLAHETRRASVAAIWVRSWPTRQEYSGLAGPFVIADTAGTGEIAYMETALSGQTVEQAEHVAQITRRWEALRAEALPHKQSVHTIEEVARTWTT